MTNIIFTPRNRAGRKLHDLVRLQAPDDLDLRGDVHRLLAERNRASASLPSAWSRPALDTRRRVPPPPPPEHDSAATPSTQPTDETPPNVPASLKSRDWSNELWKLAAALLIFAVVGAALMLVLRDGGTDYHAGQPSVGATPGVDPSATQHAAQQSLTATADSATAAAIREATVRAGVWDPGDISNMVVVGNSPAQVAAAAGSLWVTNSGDGTVSRIDAATGVVVATITIGWSPGVGGTPRQIVAYNDQIWVANAAEGTLVRIDPVTNQVVQTIPLLNADGSGSFNPSALFMDVTGLWVSDNHTADSSDGRLLHIDPVSGSILAEIPVTQPLDITSVAGDIWVISVRSYDSSVIVRVDSVMDRVISETAIGGNPSQLTPAGGALWVSDMYSRTITRIDPTTANVVASVATTLGNTQFILGTPYGVWITGWYLDKYAHGVARIDPSTNQPSYVIDMNNGSVAGMAFLDDALWVSHASGVVVQIKPGK